jgi:YHS domain-containing protein
VTQNGLCALQGYDVVAYFSLKPGDDAVKGFVEHSFEYQGYSYYFATKANLETFKASPKTYVPQWGGFCSYGVSSEDW